MLHGHKLRSYVERMSTAILLTDTIQIVLGQSLNRAIKCTAHDIGQEIGQFIGCLPMRFDNRKIKFWSANETDKVSLDALLYELHSIRPSLVLKRFDLDRRCFLSD